MRDEVGRSRRLLIPEIKRALVTKAQALCREDVAANRALGQHGQALVPDAGNVLTHCNAGGCNRRLRTAIGVIRRRWRREKRVHVWVDETRPCSRGRA